MMNNKIKDKLIIKYLLGQLSEDQMVKIEEEYVTDKNFFDQLVAVEDDLIDDYVRGRLSRRQRQQFETYFLCSAERQKKLEFARSLLMVVSEYQDQRKTLLARAMAWLKNLNYQVNQLLKSPVLQKGLAFGVVVLIIGMAWLLVHFKQKLSEQRSLKPALVSFNLLPATYRDEKSRESYPQLIISHNVQLVQLRLEVWGEETYESYRAILKAPDGEELWRQSQLKSQKTDRGDFIVLILPQNIFSDAEYQIDLLGRKSQEKFKHVGYYYFNVVRR